MRTHYTRPFAKCPRCHKKGWRAANTGRGIMLDMSVNPGATFPQRTPIMYCRYCGFWELR